LDQALPLDSNVIYIFGISAAHAIPAWDVLQEPVKTHRFLVRKKAGHFREE